MLKLYPVIGKQKSVDICRAFAQGAPASAQGAVFFGVNDSNVREFRRVKKEGGPWFSIDNSYFDRHRGTYFRATRNALQCSGMGLSDGTRFEALGVTIRPWEMHLGADILVCPQSASFMRTTVNVTDWTTRTLKLLDGLKWKANVRVRPWTPDKVKAGIDLLADLKNVRLLVTYSSASAITAILEGVPAISESGAANVLTGDLTLERVMEPYRAAWRREFANVLADNQWNLNEFKDGTAWRHLNP